MKIRFFHRVNGLLPPSLGPLFLNKTIRKQTQNIKKILYFN